MGDSWESAFDVDIRRPGEEFIQSSFNFVLEHETVLRELENNTRNEIAETAKSHYLPYSVASQPPERIFPQDLIVTDNDILRKVLIAIAFLCDEIHELQEMAKSKLFGPLIMFGQEPAEYGGDEAVDKNDGKLERMMGNLLPTLQEISNFVDRCYSVSVNLVQQLSSLLSPKEQLYKSSFRNVHLTQVFGALGELLTVQITIDKIIEQNDFLKSAWSRYKQMISFARTDAASFGTTTEAMSTFEHLLVALDRNIMSSDIFRGCIEQNYELMMTDDGEDGYVNVRGNQTFLNELLTCLKDMLEISLSTIGTSNELLQDRVDIISGFGLYALYRQLVPASIPPDAKIQKLLWSVQKTCPMILLADKAVWFPPDFINIFVPFEIKKPDPSNPIQYRKTFLQQLDSTLGSKVSLLSAQCSSWFILAESRLQPCLRHEGSIPQALDLRGSIILKGIGLANRASYLCKLLLSLHSSMEVPLNRSILNDVTILIETLKAIEITFHRKMSDISESLVLMVQQLSDACLSILLPTKLKLESSRKLDTACLDTLSAIAVTVQILKSTSNFSYCRHIVLVILTDMLCTSVFNEKDALKFRAYIKRIGVLCTFHSQLKDICDTRYLYFYRDSVLAFAITNIYSSATNANRLSYIISAFTDGSKACESIMHSDYTNFVTKYREFICQTLKKDFIQPLCRDIETDLRLHIHTKHLSHMSHVQGQQLPKQLRPFLDSAPLHVLGDIVEIKLQVAHYLNRTFYNLTTVALHDWRTYSDMKSLAMEKYGIELLDSYLPMGSLDQGLDVLQIMRNIHVFVGRFTYNMNMQQFVEFRPDKASKHVNTIKIQSIAASLRQHGLGVLNTTVNFTYQFLSQKFHVFSQFLFDDYIRAHLSREYRWYKKHKADAEVNNMYPYDRALKFVRDIRKLGVNESGKSFLDQFRILITEIGNALGYVRMVRSASMYYCSEAVKFLPEVDNIINFERHAGSGSPPASTSSPDATSDEAPKGNDVGSGASEVKGANLSEETVRAGKNLDAVISTLVANFSEGSDYFKVLVNVFQSVLLTAEHDHLRTFMMIVPALCISWTEASLLAKDSMYKATRVVMKEMYFTDDGFAIGLSYCLAILKQTNKCAALHWFDTLNAKSQHDLKQLEELQAVRQMKEQKRKEKAKRKNSFFSGMLGGKKEEDEDVDEHQDYEEVHSLQLTSKRIEAQRRETDQLFYSMSGASIFFKRTDVDT